MAGSRALTHLCQHLRGMVVGGGAKLAKGGEEMVVAGFGAGMKLAHGKRIQQVSVERGILQGRGGGRLAVGGIAWRLSQCQSIAIDAQAVLRRPLDVALGVYRAGKVIV